MLLFVQSLSALVVLALLQESSPKCLRATPALRGAAFNIRHFGKAAMKDKTKAANIVRVLRRYDLVFVQETRDKSRKSLEELKRKLGVDEWNYVSSDPVGRSRYYKEQYVYFYRPKIVELLGAQFFNDTHDVFEREPFAAQFRYFSPCAGSEVKVTLVGAHLDPDDVPVEIEGLTQAIDWAQREFPESDGIVTLGDFNADCKYLTDEQRAAATLLNNSTKYTSLIPDTADTTVSRKTNCAYDRIFLTSQGQGRVKVANAEVFDFEVGLNLTFRDAWKVSDHYPVEFVLE